METHLANLSNKLAFSIIGLSVLCSVIVPLTVNARDLHWVCGNGDWGNQTCWDNSPIGFSLDAFYLIQSDNIDRVVTYTGTGIITGDARQVTIDATGSGTMTLTQSHGALNISSATYVGIDGTGTYNQIGGTHTGTNLLLGLNSNSSGIYNLSNGTLSVINQVIGSFGTGTFTHSGGDNINTGDLKLGHAVGSHGSYTLSGTGVLSTDDQIIGFNGTGTFVQNGGTNTTTKLQIGVHESGTYTLNNGALTTSNIELGFSSNISSSGTGHFVQNDGLVNNGNLRVALNFGSTGSYTLNSGSLNNDLVLIGSSGDGAFIQTGGVHVISSTLALGGSNPGSGSYNLEGGTLNTNTVDIGLSGSGVFNQNSGTHIISNKLRIGGNNDSNNATYNLTGGNLQANIINDKSNGALFNFTGGTLTVNTFNGNLVNQGGTLAPGNSPGTTTVNGDYTQDINGILNIEIGGLFAGTEYDVLAVTGTANLGGTLDIDWFDISSDLFNATPGDSFDILSAETLIGEFDILTLALLDDDLDWQLDYLFDEVGTTDIVRLSVISAVPVPTAVWLFGSGLAVLIGLGRRKLIKGAGNPGYQVN